MVGGEPDPDRFERLFGPYLDRAREASVSSRVRAYGEMVGLLWGQGEVAATLRLEEIWCEAMGSRSFSLLCGYALDAFSDAGHAASFRDICEHHGSVLPTTGFASLSPEEQLRRVAQLEQRARALEDEIGRREQVEAERRRLLEDEIGRREQVEAERRRLLEAESAARAEVTLLYRLTDAANRAETLDQAFQVALDGIASALHADRASVLLFDSDGVMRFKAWRGLSDEYRAEVEGHSPWTADERNPVPILVDDVRTDPALTRFLPAFERERIGAVGFFPLFTGGRLLGKFMVYYPEPHRFAPDERRVAGAIADQVAFAVDRRLAMLERERVLGILGHDLRNPLGAIAMSAAALLRQDVNERVTKLVRRIVTSTDRMDRLIGQLLDLAQARHGGGIPLQRRPAHLGEIAQRVLDELEAAHPERDLSLSVEGDAAGTWDPDRLAQALSNLVANAIQHGGPGGIGVTVRADRPGEVTAEVHNCGAPIPASLLPNLFDPFRRGPSSSAAGHSVGLGLFISREIARAHGGSVEVRSSEAEGTTLTLRLPRGGAAG
jgi:signal transduction histidine kinase